ncbi:MAG: anaerobic ribonucleoside-triphosphate reductase [Holosporaceae bacterium]|jgi:hypothetical protein|nr:anaerobic ribonucleoside-triphosphate reductase [Holosporaceae bacterium]
MNEEIELRDEERSKCEVWTRVMGYHRPEDDFNIGKKSEHAERVHFDEKATCSDCCYKD